LATGFINKDNADCVSDPAAKTPDTKKRSGCLGTGCWITAES
jgi:hypothetical protein